MHVGNYLSLLADSQKELVEALGAVAKHHGAEPDIVQSCQLLASWSRKEMGHLKPVQARYPADQKAAPEHLKEALFHGPRRGGLALVRDLHDLWLLASEVHLCLTVLTQASQALRDEELETLCKRQQAQTQRQLAWMLSRIKQAAPQALVVAG